MEKNENQKTQSGTWDNIETGERKPKVEFELNKEVVVTIMCDEPREIPWEDGVFYIFEVTHEGEDKVISTSAWTLLRGLKERMPLKGKTLRIVKEMVKGKQTFRVESNEEKVEEEVVE